MTNIICEFKNIEKKFGPVHALKNISLKVYRGEVLALVGENGAGKSTLVKILTGAYTCEKGEILIEGSRVEIKNPKQAKEYGIEQVYQSLHLVPELTVAENIYLGKWHGRTKIGVNWNRIMDSADKLLRSLGMSFSPEQIVKNLSIAGRQLVAIAKALRDQPTILILDEPTAVLSEKETENLFRLIGKLKEKGVTIIYVSHRLEEIFRISDRIAVLRDGELVSMVGTQETDSEKLISSMLGRCLTEMYPDKNAIKQEIVLDVKGLTTERIHDISFKLHRGEILGIGGLMGSGRTELARALFGADKVITGEIRLDNGWSGSIASPGVAMRLGIVLMPEDRTEQALVTLRSIRENITLANLRAFSRFGVCLLGKERVHSEALTAALKVRAPSIETIIDDLSGGNKQKVVVAKALVNKPRILIADEPTQGIDVGAKAELYSIINGLAAQGMSVIIVSSEMSELIGLCHRVIVLREGCFAGEARDNKMCEEHILRLMYGSVRDAV